MDGDADQRRHRSRSLDFWRADRRGGRRRRRFAHLFAISQMVISVTHAPTTAIPVSAAVAVTHSNPQFFALLFHCQTGIAMRKERSMILLPPDDDGSDSDDARDVADGRHGVVEGGVGGGGGARRRRTRPSNLCCVAQCALRARATRTGFGLADLVARASLVGGACRDARAIGRSPSPRSRSVVLSSRARARARCALFWRSTAEWVGGPDSPATFPGTYVFIGFVF